MSKTAKRTPHGASISVTTVFGKYSPILALTASAVNPIAEPRRALLLALLRAALQDLQLSPHPAIESWRHISDMSNWLQSLVELGWATDEGGDIDALKRALIEAGEEFEQRGRLAMSDAGMGACQQCVEQFGELMAGIAERNYWHAVRHTLDRAEKVRRGKGRPGDIVVAL